HGPGRLPPARAVPVLFLCLPTARYQSRRKHNCAERGGTSHFESRGIPREPRFAIRGQRLILFKRVSAPDYSQAISRSRSESEGKPQNLCLRKPEDPAYR